MSPQSNDARRADVIYDAFAEEYRDYSASKVKYIDAVDHLIVERFGGTVETVVDYGAGDGVRGAVVFDRLGGQQLYQADISDVMIAKCKALSKAADVWDIKTDGWWKTDVRADLVVSLWNVLGHVPTTEARIETLSRLRQILKPGGSIAFDVNNRHYEGYGYWTSVGRRLRDRIAPDFSRGDVEFTWTINGVDYPASGHFFTPAEVRYLLEAAGLRFKEALAVDYRDGSVHTALSKGQIFVVAEAAQH